MVKLRKHTVFITFESEGVTPEHAAQKLAEALRTINPPLENVKIIRVSTGIHFSVTL